MIKRKYINGDEAVGVYHHFLKNKSLKATAERFGISTGAVNDWVQDIETALQKGEITRQKGRDALLYAIGILKTERRMTKKNNDVVAETVTPANGQTSKQLYAKAAELYTELGIALLKASKAEAEERTKEIVSKSNPFVGAGL